MNKLNQKDIYGDYIETRVNYDFRPSTIANFLF